MHPHDRWRQLLPQSLPVGAWRTRFAPAPTGYLHLGHLVNALHVWGVARAYGGQVLLRLEDHDRTRCKPEFEAALLDDLDWLGLHPDVYGTESYRADAGAHPARQSNQSPRYEQACSHLAERGLVYACACTRREIALAAPHAPGEEPCYPGTCRDSHLSAEATFARRVRLAPRTVAFHDLRLGRVEQQPFRQCGDVLVRDRHAQWTYQFAVVVDDMHHGIDVIIRGEDLLSSTARQLQLAQLLGRTRSPTFLHHTLLVHPDGSKLSKASGDTALRELRAAGVAPATLLADAARRAGLSTATSLPAAHIAELFR